MKRLRVERMKTGESGLSFSRRAEVSPATLSQIELGRLIPYAGQLSRIASALDWEGDPSDLLEEVPNYASH